MSRTEIPQAKSQALHTHQVAVQSSSIPSNLEGDVGISREEMNE